MVSPGELRMIDDLTSDGAYEPEISAEGTVSYSEVTQLLDDDDDDPADVLERFATRGVLASEFVAKVYVCPECTAEGLQYTTVCSTCGSAHAIETTVLEHICGYAGPETEFDAADGYRCPDCEMDLESSDVDKTDRYVCEECSETFDIPDERLWCRECVSLFQPLDAIERVLYRYHLTADGEQWLDRQKDARQTIAEVLADRRFETEIDATVTDEGASRSVHVLAEDDLLDERRIVTIHETPDEERIDAFCAFANSIDAHPVVVTTSGAVEEDVAARADGSDLTLLAYRENGTIGTDYETVESADTHRQGFFQRLTAALEVPGRKGQ